ncbi:exodeoxyribonuclease VII small subunit [Parathalassolituus penaei]|uniref:Exodeoxyribonuclease 7 small subunit n=1 Tax=Parathalassolituus penaei TaxID=2997323 RepID=A0A9X3EI72_9GAMM|nr:exodeoxyribonuclease VII small subunit [Parathalassolituus penaei]MCY0967204.1 exodeoxyribonuclease VII small subunit [Parathalassolituus penaei]
MTDSNSAFDFEQAMADLEQLVSRMERGDLTLEESLQTFEQGIRLTNACQQALSSAEQRVQVLIETAQGGSEARPFNADGARG